MLYPPELRAPTSIDFRPPLAALCDSPPTQEPALARAAAAAVTLTGSNARASNQPHVDAALAALHSARPALVEAKANKGGPRVKAFPLVNDAAAQ